MIDVLYSARQVTVNNELVLLSIGHDITENRRVQENLKKSEERFHDLADNIPNLAWMADASGWIFWYNKQWYEYTGTTLKEMQGWGWQKVHHPDYIDAITAEWSSSILEGKPYDNIFPLKGKDGNYRWFLTRVTPIRDEQGKLIRWFGTNTDITERKLAEEELKISEDKYHSLYSSMSEGVAIHEIIYNSENDPVDYVIVDINPSYEKITSLNKSDAVGKKASELYGTGKAPYMEFYALVAENGEPIEFETYFEPMDKHFKISVISPGKGKFATIFEDITERKLAEEALNESEEKYRNIVETANEGIMIGDPSGIITFVNVKMEEILGYSSEELLGTDGLFLIDKNELEIAHKQIEDRKMGMKQEYERKFIRKDGEEIWTIVSATPLQDNNGNHTGNLSMITNITPRKKREEKLKLTMDELNRSNQELERFAYVSSHDLQEPLRMVTLYSQLLERRYKDSLDSDADDFIEYIVENAKRMKQLIDDLLEYSRVTSQAKEFENVDLEKTLDVVLTNLSVSIAENNVKVTHEPLPTVFADENQMLQVFQNLITNAIKFHGQKPPEINISSHKGEGEWTFAIKDNGIGIKSEHQKQIFDVFKRLHTREEYLGTGIGLSIVQKIITHHDGRIWVESEPGKGSVFYFTIPTT